MRRKARDMLGLRNAEGRYIRDPEEMLDVIQVYYATLFGGEEQQQQTSVQRDGRVLAKERKSWRHIQV